MGRGSLDTPSWPGGLWRSIGAESAIAPRLRTDETADLVVIGGGFTGCSAALRSAELGASVRLLEASDLAAGASGRNVGLVTPGLWTSVSAVAARLGPQQAASFNRATIDAHDLVFALIAQHGIRCDAIRAGTLQCAPTLGSVAGLMARQRELVDQGVHVTMLSASEVARTTGAECFAGGLLFQTGGTINPASYCLGLARAAQKAGAKLHGQTRVHTIRREGDGWLCLTPHGSVAARRLLVATDAYHCDIDGVPVPAGMRLTFFQMTTPRLAEAELSRVLPGGEGCWVVGATMTAFRTDPVGRLIVGGAGASAGLSGPVQRAWAKRRLASLYPSLADLPLEAADTGTVLMTADALPRIVRLGPGGYSLFGYSGRGIGPGTLFGRQAAEALLKADETCLPLAPVPAYAERWHSTRQSAFRTGIVAANAAVALRILR